MKRFNILFSGNDKVFDGILTCMLSAFKRTADPRPHTGIKSIDAAVGNEYRRIRIGIGHPRDFDSQMNPVDWVLGKFDSEQLKQIQSVIKSIEF